MGLRNEDSVGFGPPRPDGLDLHEQHQVLDSKTWKPPTLVGDTLLMRDQQVLEAVRLP